MGGEALDPSFLPVYKRKHPDDFGTVCPDCLRRIEGAGSRGHGVLHEDASRPFRQAPLDTLARTVFLRFLSDGERIQWTGLEPTPVGDGVCHRVGAHGESTDVRGVPPALSQEGKGDVAHQELTLGAHGGATGVDVVGRTCAAGECKVTQTNGAFHQEIQEPLTMMAVIVLAFLGSACGDNGPTDPDSLFFAQRGSIRVTVDVPLKLGDGTLTQELHWKSSGEWSLHESIAYRDLLGDASLERSHGDGSLFALGYASVVEQINTRQGLSLFIGDSLPPDALPRDSLPGCNSVQSRLTVTLRDEAKRDSVAWTRCADGSLTNLSPEGAGPGGAASRVVLAAILVREGTVGPKWRSTYLGSIPFGTLDRGGDSGSPITTPVTFIDQAGFSSFWARHAPGRAPPAVDFSTDMVVVGLVGQRREAGDSVEIRRILQVEEGTVTEVVERAPGDFCSPVARRHVPYHIVVAPRTPIPHLFADVRVELVSCGG